MVQAQSLRNFSEASGFAARTSNPEAFDASYAYDANGNLLTLQRRNQQAALQDDFVYQYEADKNRLASVSDAVPPQTITYDTKVYDSGPIQSDGKVYRQITVEGSAEVPAGQSALLQANELIHLKQDFHAKAGSGFHAKWTDAPNTETTEDDNSTFQYDAIGNLISDSNQGMSITWTPYGKVRTMSKTDGTTINYRYDATGNRVEKQVVTSDSSYTTRYIRDASGNVLAIYENDSLAEQPIYGSSRLGIYTGGAKVGEQKLGNRRFELSNHLGNVLSVITDNVNMNADSSWATITSAQDYFAFGLEQQGRSFNTNAYRHDFNGKETDEETGWQDYGMRMLLEKYNRFGSVDPITRSYPMLTPYQFASNTPIQAIDLDGLEALSSTTIRNDGSTLIEINVDLKVRNSSQYGLPSLYGLAFSIGNQIEKSFSGTDLVRNREYRVKVNFDFSSPISPKNDYFIDFVDNVQLSNGKISTTAAGRASIGNTKFNQIQVKVRNSQFGVTRTGAHEFGHTGGLKHGQNKDSSNPLILEINNLMRQSDETLGMLINNDQRNILYEQIINDNGNVSFLEPQRLNTSVMKYPVINKEIKGVDFKK